MVDRKPVVSEEIPGFMVRAKALPEAWEKAVLRVWHEGARMETEYDRVTDEPSRDATVMIVVDDPLIEPSIHKNIPCGIEELEVYRQEIVEGIHDHWIKPEEGKWSYTYHQRLLAYQPMHIRDDGKWVELCPILFPLDQIEYLVDKLSTAPHSRRAQAITWMPTCDPNTDDPPCLQRIWMRLVPTMRHDGTCFGFQNATDKACQYCQIQSRCEQRQREVESGESEFRTGYVLEMNTHWRSRDLYRAWFMNAWAMVSLQKKIAGLLSERLECDVFCGRYVDISDSLHIYGSCFTESFLIEIEKMRSSSWQDRAMDSVALQPIFHEVRQKLSADPDHYAKGGR